MARSMSRATEPRSRMPAAAWTLITRWMVEWFTEARVLPAESWETVPR